MKGQSLNRICISMGFRSLCALLLFCLTVFMAGCKKNNDENRKLLMLLGLSTGWYTFLGGSGHETAVSTQQTADGGYIVAGSSTGDVAELQGKTPLNSYTALNDMIVIKLDRGGSVSWYTYLGGTGNDSASAIHQTADGGYIVVGSSSAAIASMGGRSPLVVYNPANPAAVTDMLAVKLTSAGAVSWFTFLGGAGNDYARSVQQTGDDGYIIAGNSQSDITDLSGKSPLNPFQSMTDMLMFKLNSTGAVSWFTFLGGDGHDYAYSVRQTRDGGYIIGGYAGGDVPELQGQDPVNPYSDDIDAMVAKLDATGTVTWYTLLGGAGDDRSYSVRQTSSGGYIVAGYTDSDMTSLQGQSPVRNRSDGIDMLVINLDPDGDVAWYTMLGDSGDDRGASVRQTRDGGYILAGTADADITSLQGVTPLSPYTDFTDMAAVKLNSAGTVRWYTFLGGSGYDYANSIQQTRDGGFILCGNSDADITEMQNKAPLNPHASVSDIMVVKLKSNGRL